MLECVINLLLGDVSFQLWEVICTPVLSFHGQEVEMR